jgi:hypothetical protein
MTLKLAEAALWQHKVASLVRSGLLERVEIVAVGGLFRVVGVYGDGTRSAPLAKYVDRRRAEDALNIVDCLIAPGLPVARN